MSDSGPNPDLSPVCRPAQVGLDILCLWVHASGASYPRGTTAFNSLNPKLALVVAAAAVCAVSAVPASGGDPPPLIGSIMTHESLLGCSLDRTGIVLHYDSDGMRRRVRAELAAMHAAGLQTVRILLWNMADITGHDWGIVPSRGGKLVEPYRSNLIRFVSDIKAAGFVGLTISFGPEWTNSPQSDQGPGAWDPSKLDENWGLLEDVHKLVAPFAPPIMHYDPIQEGAPSSYQPPALVAQIKSYIATMWTRYATAFGKDDVTVAVIAKAGRADWNDRMENLLETFKSTGLGYPAFFEVHPSWTSPEAYNDLIAADNVLRAYGLTTQPLVVGESSYENAAVAADIARFMRDRSRRISEVYEWWNTIEGGPCASAPYRADAYIAALTDGPVPPATPSPLPLPAPPTLSVTLSRAGVPALYAADGAALTTIEAGTYRLIIRDQSTTAGLRIALPGLELTTGKRFVGTRTWTGDIGNSAPYGSTGTVRATARPVRVHTVVIH
jgi:hypothetical protein